MVQHSPQQKGKIKQPQKCRTFGKPSSSKPPLIVNIYTTPTCPYCLMAKHWLTQKRIPFTEINVLENEKARERIISKSGSTAVPQIEIGRAIIVGFDREELEIRLLKRKKP